MHINTSDGAEKALAALRYINPLAASMAAHPAGKNPPFTGDINYEHESALRHDKARSDALLADDEEVGLAAGRPTAKDNPCPDCGSPVHNWYSGNPLDPGDVDPRADCTNPNCDWGY